MRGTDKISGSLVSYGDIEDCIGRDTRCDRWTRIVDKALASLGPSSTGLCGGRSTFDRTRSVAMQKYRSRR